MTLGLLREQIEQVIRVLGVIEDQQPVAAAAQFLAERGDRLIVVIELQSQCLGELDVVAAHRGRVLGPNPPHRAVGGIVPEGVLNRQPGFAESAESGDDLHSGGRTAGSK